MKHVFVFIFVFALAAVGQVDQSAAWDSHCKNVLHELKGKGMGNVGHGVVAGAFWLATAAVSHFEFLLPVYLPQLRVELSPEQRTQLNLKLQGKSETEAKEIIYQTVPESSRIRFYDFFKRVYNKLLAFTLAYSILTVPSVLNAADEYTRVGGYLRETKNFVDYSYTRTFTSEDKMRELAFLILEDFAANKAELRENLKRMSFDELYALIR